MTKEATLQDFWSKFGLQAFEENSVPTGDGAPKPPYITYQVSTSDFNHKVALTASLWYKDQSWLKINKKAKEISEYIGTGIRMPCEDGMLQIFKADLFAQSLGDNSSDLIKRKVINIIAEFITAY